MIARGIGDSTRLGIMGMGFDAYRALYALTLTDRFKAASVDVPLYDLVALYDGAGAGAHVFDDLIGGSPTEKPDEYARISPANHADRLRTPTLVAYPPDTPGTPTASQGRALARALRKNGTPVEVIAYTPSPASDPWGARTLDTLVRRNLEWFRRWIPTRPPDP